VQALAISLVAVSPVLADDAADDAKRIAESIEVLNDLTSTPDAAIPNYVLERAEAIVVIPSLVKGGFVVGAEHGKGVMSVRDRTTNQWSAPSFVKMTGGSIGWQIGLQTVDLLKSEFTLGGNASVAAGPVGRSAEASTDATMGAKILAYSRAKGLFAGATLEGSSLRSDDDSNARFYGRDISPKVIAESGNLTAPPAAKQWRDALSRSVARATASR
jgi:lipid-binding SYLF domain-containing protein